MKAIEQLIRTANNAEASPQRAVEAMIELARIYGEGREGVEVNLLEALNWAEKAAYCDSADGYLEITRIVGSACIAENDPSMKQQYAEYVIGTCDLDTLRRHKRPDIAYNVGTVCEYMGYYKSKAGAENEAFHFRSLGIQYYHLTLGLPTIEKNEASIKSTLGAKEGIRRLAKESARHLGFETEVGRPCLPAIKNTNQRKYILH